MADELAACFPPKVLFVNDNWGYGSTTIAIAIADEVTGKAVRSFAGAGSAYDLARRAAFDRLIAVDTMTTPAAPVLEAAIGQSDIVLSVQNPRAAHLARRHGVACVYVDSLTWMWPKQPELPAGSPYFAEWFPEVDARLEEWRSGLPEAEAVGPIIDAVEPLPAAERRGLLANFGGLSASLIPDGALAGYAAVMTECVAQVARELEEEITICAGKHVLAELKRRLPTQAFSGVTLADLDHQRYLRRLSSCRMFVSSAGLHASYEAFARGVPCAFLPAQNLSQALAIPRYREAGLPSPDWDEIYGLAGLSATAEREACQEIARCVARFERDQSARARLVSYLLACFAEPELRRRSEAQTGFVPPFAERGAARIGRHLLEVMERRTEPVALAAARA